MFQNFEEVKRQLSELSEVINKFKSEAAQLRIVEIVLGDGSYHGKVDDGRNDEPEVSVKPRRRKTSGSKPMSKAETNASSEKPSKKSRSSGDGAVSTLNDLVDGSFFKTLKTISSIVTHCEEKLARRFKANDFSGKLGRLTRQGVLDRNKNIDG